MPLPLIAAAVAAGAARSGAGILSGNTIAKRQGRLIRDAYEINQKQLGLDQGHIRQQSLESLNARGILNAGSSGPAPVPVDPRGGLPPGSNPSLANIRTALNARKAAGAQRFDLEGRRGETGAANTLGGQVEKDLSEQFTLERKDLWNQRQSGIAQVKADHRQHNVNSVAGGIQTGLSIYNAFAGAGGLTPEQSAEVSAPATLGATGGPQSIRGAFGLSPIDGSGVPQIGVAQPGSDVYNFHVNPETGY